MIPDFADFVVKNYTTTYNTVFTTKFNGTDFKVMKNIMVLEKCEFLRAFFRYF